MKCLYLFPFLLILSVFACREKPASSTEEAWTRELNHPIILEASLADSLPARALKQLDLDDISGINVKYLDGKEVRYFEYQAKKDVLLRTIGHLPFSIHGTTSDVACRQLDRDILSEMKAQTSAYEVEHTSFFWDVDRNNIEVYECIKGTFRHTLLIDINSNHILHRIEQSV